MGPYQQTPKEVARAIRYSGLGVPSVGPVGDFLELLLQVIDERGSNFKGFQKPPKKNLGDIRQKPTMKPLGSKFSLKNHAGSLVHSHISLKKIKPDFGQCMKQTKSFKPGMFRAPIFEGYVSGFSLTNLTHLYQKIGRVTTLPAPQQVPSGRRFLEVKF